MTQQFDIYRQLLLLLMRSKRAMAILCEKRNLTPVQAMLLMQLHTYQPYSMNELSDAIGCDASNITGLVDRLNSQGLIEQTIDENDRRIKMVRLSSKGEKCRRELLEGIKQAELLDLEKLSKDEEKKLIKLIKKLI